MLIIALMTFSEERTAKIAVFYNTFQIFQPIFDKDFGLLWNLKGGTGLQFAQRDVLNL